MHDGGMHGGRGVHGGGVWWGACMAHMPPTPADTTRYGAAVNEQAVRILLECILVEVMVM